LEPQRHFGENGFVVLGRSLRQLRRRRAFRFRRRRGTSREFEGRPQRRSSLGQVRSTGFLGDGFPPLTFDRRRRAT
jgi:hypothetical protein